MPAGASRSVPAEAPPVLQYNRATEQSLKRLVKLGVVKLTPTPDGTGVNLTRQGRVAFTKPKPGMKPNPAIKRADLRLLQSLAARDCARVRATKIETAADVEQARLVARAERQATRDRTKADVEKAKQQRDLKRARASKTCESGRERVREAKGGKRPRVSASERARERIQLRDAEVAAAFGRVPGALEVYRKSGGGIRWGGPRGVERFGEYLHDLGREVGRHAATGETTRADERALERAEALEYRDRAIREGRLDEAAEIEVWLRENPRRRPWPRRRRKNADAKPSEKTYSNSAQSLTETCDARGDDGPHRWGIEGRARTCSYCGMDRPTKASRAWWKRNKS